MMTDVAFDTLLDQAENGEAKAQGLVAWDYYTGYRIGRSFKKAIFWGKLAFDNGDELGGIATANALILSEKETEGLEVLEKLIQKGSFHAKMARLHFSDRDFYSKLDNIESEQLSKKELKKELHHIITDGIQRCLDFIEASEQNVTTKREKYYQFLVKKYTIFDSAQ